MLQNFGVSGLPSKAPKVVPIYWLASTAGWIKLNIDGAVAGSTGSVSCGGVFRIPRGFIKGCFYSPFGILSAFEAELWGLFLLLNMQNCFLET